MGKGGSTDGGVVGEECWGVRRVEGMRVGVLGMVVRVGGVDLWRRDCVKGWMCRDGSCGIGGSGWCGSG